MQFFLRLKAWQLFSAIFALPLLGPYVLTMFSHAPEVEITAPVFRILATTLLFANHAGVYIALERLNPSKAKSRIFLIVLFVIICIAGYTLLNLDLLFNRTPIWYIILQASLIPFVIFGFVFIPYSIARQLRSIELEKPVSVTDCITDTLLLMFYFIGVWLIQPRINKLVSHQSN